MSGDEFDELKWREVNRAELAGTVYGDDLPTLMDERATLDDVVPLLGRIADALEAQVRPNACGELHKTGAKCVLDDRHVGHHTSGNGRLHWLDEE